jgi:hypothetical protein
MNMMKRLQILDAEIERLKQVRALLSGRAVSDRPDPKLKTKASKGVRAAQASQAKR